MSSHQLFQKAEQVHEYELRYRDGELYRNYGSAAHVSETVRATILCSCGETFRKESTAIAHLESV